MSRRRIFFIYNTENTCKEKFLKNERKKIISIKYKYEKKPMWFNWQIFKLSMTLVILTKLVPAYSHRTARVNVPEKSSFDREG